MNQIAISVIVPCYNVEPYLDCSLGCLERQWHDRTDYEIIFVNDASTDGTINKLNEFKDRYPENSVIIDKKLNEGVAMARNNALDIARGKWVAFFDPDDAFASRGFSDLLELAESNGVDILSYELVAVREDECDVYRIDNREQVPTIEWTGSTQEFMLRYSFGVCTSFLFKREVISDHRFPCLLVCEDVVFNIPIFLSCLTVGRCNISPYIYIMHSTSATNTIDAVRLGRTCDDLLKVIRIIEYYKQDQDTVVKDRLFEQQSLYVFNLSTRMMLSDKSVKEITEICKSLKRMSLFPIQEQGRKAAIYNLILSDSVLLKLFRPFYRFYRKMTSKHR